MIVRGALRTILGAFALAAAIAAAAPREAQAQSGFTRIVDLETIGGFTAWKSRIAVWHYQPTGRGFVLYEKSFHNGTKLALTMQISRAETIDLWWAAYRAAPWTAPEVRAAFLNVDLPDVRVTYMRRWSQLIRASVAPPSLPPVSAEMEALTQRLWDIASRCEDAELFRYEAAGGLLGYSETTVITQGGKIVSDVAYARGSPPDEHKEGRVSPEEVNELKQLCASWWSLPDRFDWPPGMVVMDGISYRATYSVWGYSRTIASKTGAQEHPSYKAALAKVAEFRDRL